MPEPASEDAQTVPAVETRTSPGESGGGSARSHPAAVWWNSVALVRLDGRGTNLTISISAARDATSESPGTSMGWRLAGFCGVESFVTVCTVPPGPNRMYR